MKNSKLKLTQREVDILEILWSSKEALIASDIAKSGNNLSINTVQATLRTLLSKKIIKIDDIVYSGKVLTRSYRPSMSRENFMVDQLKNQYQKIDKTIISVPKIIATLIENDKNEMTIIEDLEKMIAERKKMLSKEGD